MIANNEKCANQDKSVCDYNEFRRLKFFHGMLLDDKDFQAEQDYHTRKRRFLNRMLHGAGVVCGLGVNGKKEGRWIEITSGLALDCSGNEIWVPRTMRIDLAAILPRKDKTNQLECEDEDAVADKLTPYWIGIRYEEKPTNPVSVYLPSGSCEERTCENSRYKEGYCVELLKDCPDKPKDPPRDGLLEAFCKCETAGKYEKDEELMCQRCGGLEGANLCKCEKLEKFCEQSVPCPECCSCDESCHVVLGKIEVDKDCRLRSICINDCRRYVITGRMLQSMLVGVLSGAEKYFYMDVNGRKEPLPSAEEIARNPIATLCWFLRNQAIEGGKLEVRLCNKEPRRKPDAAKPAPEPQKPASDIALTMAAMQRRLDEFEQRLGGNIQTSDLVEGESKNAPKAKKPPSK
jgi:hypothetical protein